MRKRLGSLRVKAGEMRPRLSGFSLLPPNVQFSWPAPSIEEAALAREVVAYLEDRRVLYAPEELEVTDHCIQSVLDMRRFLTAKIGELDQSSELAGSLRTLRAACRKFLDLVDGPTLGHGSWGRGIYGDRAFWSALGELRGVSGVCVASIAERYGLDVEAPLASILPAAPAHND
ncbi:MAG: DUF6650 family protein [Candidatus Limnocylindrales bacterium]